MLYKSNLVTLETIGYIVGLMIDMYIEYCLWAQSGRIEYILHILDCLGQDMQVLYLGRAPRTKETLPDFLKWRRVTRPPLVFRGLTGSQRTPGFGASHLQQNKSNNQDGIVEHKNSTKVQYWVLVVIWGIMDEHLELDKVQLCTKNHLHKILRSIIPITSFFFSFYNIIVLD